MFDSIKKFFINFYYRNGQVIGRHLLTSAGIAGVFIVILLILGGQQISFSIILGWSMALPLFAAFVAVMRLVINLIHKIIPMNPGVAKVVVDAVILAFIMLSIGFLLRDVEVPESEVLQTIVTLFFDVAYIALTIFLLSAGEKE